MMALDQVGRGRKAYRPLRLWMRPSIRLLLLFNSRPGPKWSANPLLWLLLGFYLYLHSLHDSGFFHQGRKVLDGKWGYHQANVSSETIVKLPAMPLLIEQHGVETPQMLEPLGVLGHWLVPLCQLRNSTSFAYLTLSGKYSERNLLLKASHMISSCLSSITSLMLAHQCSTSHVSM